MRKKLKRILRPFLLFILVVYLPSAPTALANSDSLNKRLSESQGRDKLPLLRAVIKREQYVNMSDYMEYARDFLITSHQLKDPEYLFEAHCLMTKAYFQNHELILARAHADSAFDMSITKDKDSWYARSLMLQAMFSIRSFQLEDAKIQLDAVARIYESSGREELMAKVWLKRASIAEHQNKIPEAENDYNQAIKLARKHLDSLDLIPYKKFRADFFLRRGSFVKALTAYSALSSFEQKNKLDYALANSLVGIATIYLSINQCQDAKEILNNAFVLAMSSNNQEAKANALKYLGNCLAKQGKLRLAEDNYLKALKIFEEINQKLGRGRVNNNLGVVAVQKRDFGNASEYFNKAMDIYSEFPFLYSRSKTLRNLGKLYLETGPQEKGLEFLDKSNELAEQGSYTEVLQMNYSTLANYYNETGDKGKAFEYLQKVDVLRELSVSKFYSKLISMQNTYNQRINRYEYRLKNVGFKNEQEIARLEEKFTYLYWLFGLLMLVAGIVVFWVIKTLRDKKRSLKEHSKMQTSGKEQNEKDIRIAQYTFNNLGDGVIWAREDGSILYLNQAARNYSTEENVTHMNNILPGLSPQKWQELWKDLASEHPYIVKECSIDIAKKSIPTEVSFNMLSFEGANFVAVLLKDISFRKRTEKSLREAKEHAEESDKLKTRFIANMSHEIRTPLNAIDGFTSELLEENDPKERAYYIDMINKSSKRLINLIDDIIDISQIEAQKMRINIEQIELEPLLRELISVYRHNIKASHKNVDIIDDFPSAKKRVMVYADRNRYYQVLNNLMNNAAKFTSRGEIRVGYKLLDTGLVEVFIHDTGIGIKREDKPGIFKVFSQADISDTRPFQGSGLGLTISKKLMDLMHGSLTFESEEGKGSRFATTLKGTVGESLSIKPLDDNINGISVFIISDSSTSSSFLNAILKKKEVVVDSFNNFKKALEAISTEQPDAVIVGKGIVMYGEEKLCQLIRHSAPRIKIILMSEGSDLNHDLYDALIEPHYNKNEIYDAIASAMKK